MKQVLFIFLLVTNLQLAAESHIIDITLTQFDNLGIKVAQLKIIRQVPLFTAPAKVVIPPDQEYIVSTTQAGLISKVNAALGDRVSQGQVLAQITSPELVSLQRQYLKSRSEMNLVRARYQRDKKLLDEGIIPKKRWQETKSKFKAFMATANEIKQLLEIAGMSQKEIHKLASSQQLNSQLNIYSPIHGVVLERMAVTGKKVDILAPIFRVANLEQLWLEINIPQERMENVNIGNTVRIENTPITATITLLGQNVNAQAQTVLVRAVINPPLLNIRAGQTVNTRIFQNVDKDAFLVSNSAITYIEGKSYIFIKVNNSFKLTSVKIIGKQNDQSTITSIEELTENTRVAIRGTVALKAIIQGLGDEE